jgi:hypothetical protein
METEISWETSVTQPTTSVTQPTTSRQQKPKRAELLHYSFMCKTNTTAFSIFQFTVERKIGGSVQIHPLLVTVLQKA